MNDMSEHINYEYKLRHEKLGGHYHCSLFSRRRGTATWAKCGDIVLSAEEWVSFKLSSGKIALENYNEESHGFG